MRTTILPSTPNVGTTPIKGKWLILSGGDKVSLQLVAQGVTGIWQILVSNRNDVAVNDDPNAADVTGMFDSYDGGPLPGAAVTGNVYAQSRVPFWGGAINVVFTPTSGSGTAQASVNVVDARVSVV